MIRYRALDLPADDAPLARLDTSFETDVVLAVDAAPNGLTLRETRVDPPRRKRYDVPVTALAAASACLVAERDGVPVGVAAVELRGWNRRAELVHLYVDRGARGLGVGRGLVAGMRREATRLGARCLWVETQNVNAPAIAFYRRLGFTWCGLDASLYDPREAPGETAIFLVLQLDA